MKHTNGPRPVSRRLLFGSAVIVVLVALSACAAKIGAASTQSSASPAAAVLNSSRSATAAGQQEPTVAVVRQVTPAVVNITSRVPSAGVFGGGTTSSAVGTGFIVESDGVILTNQHVIENASDITVTLSDGSQLAASVLATDVPHDLAVLKVDAQNLPTVTLGDSSQVVMGERVVAIGYALDLQGGPTVTSGIVSSLARTIQMQDPSSGLQGSVRTYRDVLQTDAALNAGNSGGPLVTLDGRVVAVNAAGSAQAENIGFAIAIDVAKPLIAQAIA
jgi:S1-C subfamily serine protease